uniref:Protein deadpan n=1 Tax=Lygus hesperus TaxID=30085 RepID=A0A0A9ZCH5_LYGHE
MVTTSEPPAAPIQRPRCSETRRSNKPIMEKRRRARINNCLNELKSLILDAMKKDPARHSKLEKADILEMTVKHVETLQRHQAALAAAADPTVVNKFKAGWGECVTEIGKFPGIDLNVKRRLVEHLSTCMDNRDGCTSPQQIAPVSPRGPSPAAPITPISHPQQNLVLVPASTTRLPNGEYAFVISSPPPLPQPLAQPLSLVVNKSSQGNPWRPW